MGQMLTVEEVANILDVHKRTVLRMIDRGELEATKVGRVWRIPPHAVDAIAGRPVSNGIHVGDNLTPLQQMLASAAHVLRSYCEATGKDLAELTVEDFRRMTEK